MNGKPRFQIKLLFSLLICIPVCFPQARQNAPKQANRPGAPFLQQLKSYDETQYVTKAVFKSGLTVLVNEFKAQPVVSIQIYVQAGYLADPPQSPGTARVVAGMVQRGMSDKSSGTYRQKVQALGGRISSDIGPQTTMLEVVSPATQWKRALNVQAEAILNPSFDPDEMAREAKLLLGEARGFLDDPRKFGREGLLELAFGPRMRNSSAFTGSASSSVTPETVSTFYKSQYMPSRMMLVVSGDVLSSEILNEVTRVYAKPAGAAAAKLATTATQAPQNGLHYSAVRGKVALPHLFFGFRTPSAKEDDFKALEIVRAVLGSGEASIINARLRDQKRLVLSADARLTPLPDFGLFSIEMNVDPANIDKSEIALLTEIELLKRGELSDADIARALAQLERSYWESIQTVTGRARLLAHFEDLGDWKLMDRYLPDLKRIKAADVKRVVEKYLRLDNCSILEYLPAAGEERQMTAEGIRRTLEGLLEPAAGEEQTERDKETVLDIKIPPVAANFKVSEIRYPFQVASILRGPDLFIREDHTCPVIEMGLFFPGGKFDEKQENAGITKLLTRLMLRGGASAAQFYRQFETYGGKVRPVVTDDYFGIQFSILSQNFEAGFVPLLDTILSPIFDKNEIQKQKEIQLSAILQLRNSDGYSSVLADRLLFGNFSYALPSEGTEESLAKIGPDSLKSWFEEHVKNKKPIVVAVGDTKGTSLAGIFVQRFSGSRIQGGKIPETFAQPLGKGIAHEQDWNRNESLILIGFQAPPEDDEDVYPVAVFQSYAGDPGKLSQELRDRLGVAYQVGIDYRPRLRGGSILFRAAASPDREDEALKALREGIQKLGSDPIPYRDFRSAINEAIGEHAIRGQLRSAQIKDLTENVLAGKGIEGYQAYVSGLQDVKEEDLQAVIQRILKLDNAVILRMHAKK